jgi:hypothetical protein
MPRFALGNRIPQSVVGPLHRQFKLLDAVAQPAFDLLVIDSIAGALGRHTQSQMQFGVGCRPVKIIVNPGIEYQIQVTLRFAIGRQNDNRTALWELRSQLTAPCHLSITLPPTPKNQFVPPGGVTIDKLVARDGCDLKSQAFKLGRNLSPKQGIVDQQQCAHLDGATARHTRKKESKNQ